MKKRNIVGLGAFLGIIGAAAGVLRQLRMGSRYVLDYVEETEKMPCNVNMVIEKDGFYSLRKNDNSSFKILQITDLHVGGGYLSRHEDLKALKIMKNSIIRTKPDCVVLTGDLVCSKTRVTLSRNNFNSVKIISRMLEKMGIPYAVTWGNHDSEPHSTHLRSQISDYLTGLEHSLFVLNDNNKNIKGFSNYPVKLRNKDGSINSVLYMLDSNEYTYVNKKRVYDYIHDDQVKWYENEVKRIEQEEGINAPSYIFTHIPIPEFDKAWKAYEAGSIDAVYYYGNKDEAVSSSPTESKLFEKVLELGSTKGIFCGHDHLNDFSIGYKGVRLTYGQGIDCILYARNLQNHKGATLLKINTKREFSISAKKHRRMD